MDNEQLMDNETNKMDKKWSKSYRSMSHIFGRTSNIVLKSVTLKHKVAKPKEVKTLVKREKLYEAKQQKQKRRILNREAALMQRLNDGTKYVLVIYQSI